MIVIDTRLSIIRLNQQRFRSLSSRNQQSNQAGTTRQKQNIYYQLPQNVQGKNRLPLARNGKIFIRESLKVVRPHQFLEEKNRGNLYAIDNPNYTGSETDRTDGSQAGSPRKEIDALPFHYFFSMPSNVWKANQILPNPYNKRNHQFHSTLHCPCFFFFFFICCLPGVYLMQRSDKKFKKGQSLEAKKYGRLSTIMFVLGSIAGVVFLGVAIYFAASYVRQFVD